MKDINTTLFTTTKFKSEVENDFYNYLITSYLGLIGDAIIYKPKEVKQELEQFEFGYLTEIAFDDDDELYVIENSVVTLGNGSGTILVFDVKDMVLPERLKRFSMDHIRLVIKRFCKNSFFEYHTTNNDILVFFRNLDTFDLEKFYNHTKICTTKK